MMANTPRARAPARVRQPVFVIRSCGDAYDPLSQADVMSLSFGNALVMTFSTGTKSLMGSPPVSSFSSNQMKMGTCVGCAPDQVATMPRHASNVGQVLFGSMTLMW